MKNHLIAAILFAISSQTASANCLGSSSFSTCYDNSGNNYTVSRFGNTTVLNGRNSNGSSWDQTSTTFGNTTIHNGTAADGGSWNSNTTHLGNGNSITSGTDSNGNSFSSSCIGGVCY